jgi:DNA polymerase III epsilon subunit-like protein
VFDTETNGLITKEIISLSYLYFEGKELKKAGYEVMNPMVKIEPAASRVNGFYDEDVKDKPTFEEIWKNIKDYFIDSVWVCQNTPFDAKAVSSDLERYKLPIPHHYELDTCAIAKQMIKRGEEIKNHKLATLCEYFGYSFEGYHSADVDTYACMKVYNSLINLNKTKFNGAYDYLFVPIEVEGTEI